MPFKALLAFNNEGEQPRHSLLTSKISTNDLGICHSIRNLVHQSQSKAQKSLINYFPDQPKLVRVFIARPLSYQEQFQKQI